MAPSRRLRRCLRRRALRLRQDHRARLLRDLHRWQPAEGPLRWRRYRTQPHRPGKSGWKWSIATERNGVPIGWVTAAANRNDCVLLAPTLDAVAQRGLLLEIETLHLDWGYDNQVVRQECAQRGLTDVVIAQKRQQGKVKTKKLLPLGQRWPVERTNSWFTNYGLLRRSTDGRGDHRQAMMALAAAFILTFKLFIWADCWNR